MFFEYRSSSITKLTKQILDTVSISIPSSCLKQDRIFMYILCIISFMCSERKNTKSLFSSQLFSIYSKNQPCHGLIVVNPPCCQRAWYNLTSQGLSTRCTDKDPAGDSWIDEVCTTSTKRWRSAGLMKSKKDRPSTCDFTAGVWAFELSKPNRWMLTGTIWLEEMEHSLEQNVFLPMVLPRKMEDKGENLLQTFSNPGCPRWPKNDQPPVNNSPKIRGLTSCYLQVEFQHLSTGSWPSTSPSLSVGLLSEKCSNFILKNHPDISNWSMQIC